jgi:hypothetical protein
MNLPNINESTIIITFIDYAYLPIFNLWYTYFSKLNLNNLLVISLDKEIYAELQERNIKTILCEYRIYKEEYWKDRDEFWKFRLNIIYNIFISSRKNIIHTDSDCIWLKNIYGLIKDLPYDFIGSIEKGHPHEVSKQYGFVMCCGFYYIKYNEKMVSLFKNIMMQTNLGTDDQSLFNYYMFNNMLEIIESPTDLIEKEIQLKDVTIRLLNNRIISRDFFNEDTYCFHPWLSSITISEKLRQLNKFIDQKYV